MFDCSIHKVAQWLIVLFIKFTCCALPHMAQLAISCPHSTLKCPAVSATLSTAGLCAATLITCHWYINLWNVDMYVYTVVCIPVTFHDCNKSRWILQSVTPGYETLWPHSDGTLALGVESVPTLLISMSHCTLNISNKTCTQTVCWCVCVCVLQKQYTLLHPPSLHAAASVSLGVEQNQQILFCTFARMWPVLSGKLIGDILPQYATLTLLTYVQC